MEKEEERGERLIQRERERGWWGDRGPMGGREEKFSMVDTFFCHHIIFNL